MEEPIAYVLAILIELGSIDNVCYKSSQGCLQVHKEQADTLTDTNKCLLIGLFRLHWNIEFDH